MTLFILGFFMGLGLGIAASAMWIFAAMGDGT